MLIQNGLKRYKEYMHCKEGKQLKSIYNKCVVHRHNNINRVQM